MRHLPVGFDLPADLKKVPGVKEWWHTDGLYLWREGGRKLNGQAAANALRGSLEKAATQLPCFRRKATSRTATLSSQLDLDHL